MQYPTLSENQTSRTMVEEFTGYNHNLRISEGESYDMQNMTCDNYPVLSTRTPRVKMLTAEKPNGMIAKDALVYIDGTTLYYNFKPVDLLQYGISLTDSEKTLVSMGAYLLIFPDKVMYNTQTGEAKEMEHIYSSSEGDTVTFSLCTQDGSDISAEPSVNAPEKPENGSYWIDVSSTPNVLKRWSESSSMWVQVPTVYVKIYAAGIGKGFSVYDGVAISGCTAANTGAFNNTSVLWAVSDDYIVIIGTLDDTVSQTTPITVKRTIPDFDFSVESNNRLWLCKYGRINFGNEYKTVNEIYASKLGDPTNFYCYMGVSTDSYAVSLGSDGIFTGAVTYGGYPIFFKENCIHKVYGTMPSNYQVQTTNARGVQKGSQKSLQIVNEVLYYKSASDICAYEGGLPTTVSTALGSEYYKNAVAGERGGKYYVSMRDNAGDTHLFVYDTSRGFWTKEDSTNALFFARMDDDLLFFDSKNNLWCVENKSLVLEQSVTQETAFDWCHESGNIGFSYQDNKYIARFNIRLILPVGSTACFSVQYDSSEEWEKLFEMQGSGTRSFTVQAIPHRCDHMRYKLEGHGKCKIISVSKVLEQGSDAV